MFKLFEIPFPWSDPLDFFFLCETTHDTCMNVYERACMCVCARDKRRTNVFSKDDRCKQKRLKRTNVSLERENRERDSHATEALLRTLDDRGRSKGHRYRPACDALRTVAGDVEGGQEQRAKETSRREKRGGGKGAETAEYRKTMCA